MQLTPDNPTTGLAKAQADLDAARAQLAELEGKLDAHAEVHGNTPVGKPADVADSLTGSIVRLQRVVKRLEQTVLDETAKAEDAEWNAAETAHRQALLDACTSLSTGSRAMCAHWCKVGDQMNHLLAYAERSAKLGRENAPHLGAVIGAHVPNGDERVYVGARIAGPAIGASDGLAAAVAWWLAEFVRVAGLEGRIAQFVTINGFSLPDRPYDPNAIRRAAERDLEDVHSVLPSRSTSPVQE